MEKILEEFIISHGGERLDEKSWRMQTPKRVISTENTGDLLVSSLAVIKREETGISTYLPLGEVPGAEVSAILGDMIDLPAKINGRAALLVRPNEERSVVISLGNSFYLAEEVQTEEFVRATLLSLLDSLADFVAEMMTRSDIAMRNGSRALWLFLKEQASMSIVLEKASRTSSGKIEVREADLNIGQIQQELYDFTKSLSPEEKAHLKKLTEELKKKDPLSLTEEEFREELHHVTKDPKILSAKEAARATKEGSLAIIYHEIKSHGPVEYQYAWVIYDLEKQSQNAAWHSADAQEFHPHVILTLEHSQSGSYIGLFLEGEHENLLPSERMDIETFKETVTPLAKDFF